MKWCQSRARSRPQANRDIPMDAISADFSFTKATASERVTVVLGPGNPSSVGIGRVTVKGIGKRPSQNNVMSAICSPTSMLKGAADTKRGRAKIAKSDLECIVKEESRAGPRSYIVGRKSKSVLGTKG